MFDFSGKGLNLSFDARASFDPDGRIVSTAWDFGDGSTTTGVQVSHSYKVAGSYTVRVSVSDDKGSYSTASKLIEVSFVQPVTPPPPVADNKPPAAVLSFSANGRNLSFDASGSSDPDGRIVSTGWDFGDGSTATGVQVNHRYEAVGDYTVKITVTDDKGSYNTSSKPIEVTFVHPGVGLSKADLEAFVANNNTAPWKAVYDSHVSYSPNLLNYTMRGPCVGATRNPDLCRGEYESDMGAVYGLTLSWYLTKNSAYADKAVGIMEAWATTNTSLGGAEAILMNGDYIHRNVVAMDILRGLYPGWTATNTKHMKDYFRNVYWGLYGMGIGDIGAGSQLLSANQGAEQLIGSMAIAVFLDDQAKFDMAVNAWRTDPNAGLPDSLSNGEIGDSGRDSGHAYGEIFHLALAAETAWKQGVDLFGDLNNRMLSISEYYSGWVNGGTPAWIKFGTGYGLYDSLNAEGGGINNRVLRGNEGLNILYNAYVTRKKLAAPETLTLRNKQGENAETALYRRDVDTSTAVAPAPAWREPARTATTQLDAAEIGAAHLAGNYTYNGALNNGTWTVNAAGIGQEWNYHYLYKKLTGDFTFSARIASASSLSATPDHGSGLMMRTNLDASGNSQITKSIELYTIPGGEGQLWWRGGTGYTIGMYQNIRFGAPYWVKMVRRGNFIYSYTSPDGSNWAPAGNVRFPGLPDAVYMGLFSISGDSNALSTQVYDNVAYGTAPSSLAPPANQLTATSNTNAIALKWAPSNAAVYYEVRRATTAGGPYATLATEVRGTNYSDTSAVAGTTYYYVVGTASFGGLSANSTEVSAVRK